MSSSTRGNYRFDKDPITDERIPFWLSDALVRLICALASSNTATDDDITQFTMSAVDYESIQDSASQAGWFIRRTAIHFAYQKFQYLKIDAVRLRASSISGGFDSRIPTYIKVLAKEIETLLNMNLEEADEEFEDIARLTTAPTIIAQHLDKFSIEFPTDTHRAIKIASLVESEDVDGEVAKTEVEQWAKEDSCGRLVIESRWLKQAKTEVAALEALMKGVDLQQEVKSYANPHSSTEVPERSQKGKARQSEESPSRKSSLKKADQDSKSVRFATDLNYSFEHPEVAED